MIAELQYLCDNLPECITIPHFGNVNLLLDDLFVQQDSPCQQLINHYYFTGRRQDDKDILHDPAERAHWCRVNLPYFSVVAKRIRQIRNKIVHNDVLTMQLFKSGISSIINFAAKNHLNSKILVDKIIESLCFICKIMVSGEYKEIKFISVPLPLYYIEKIGMINGTKIITVVDNHAGYYKNGKVILDDNNILDDPYTLIQIVDKNVKVTLNIELITINAELADTNSLQINKLTTLNTELTNTNSSQINELTKINTELTGSNSSQINELITSNMAFNSEITLNILKLNGYKEKLKGKKIIIKNGKFANKKAIFRSWSGSVAHVDIENEGRSTIGLKTRVIIIDNDISIPLINNEDIPTKEKRTSMPVIMPTEELVFDKIYNLKDLREKGYKDYLKGKMIMIKSGPYAELKGYIVSWSGTVVNVELPNRGKVIVRIITDIILLNEQEDSGNE